MNRQDNNGVENALLGPSVIPRYRQVEAILRDQIRSGELAPGDQVPTEECLRERFGVSRATIRQAMQILEQDDLIYRAAGRGTFVNKIIERLPLQLINIQMDDLSNIDIFDKIVLHRKGHVAARNEIQTSLAVNAGEEIFFFIRVFWINEEPVGGEKVHVLPSIGHQLTPDHMIAPNIRDVIAERTRKHPAKFEQRIGGLRTDAVTSVLFQSMIGAPLIAVHSTSYDNLGAPIDHSHLLFRSDRCHICVTQYPA